MSSGNLNSSDDVGGSPLYIRNPSPPPELTQNTEIYEADSIGNTTFSKHWLFSTLMKLIEEVEKESKTTEATEFGVDVDEELQNELCKLWDMSMNTDVVKFLNEFKAIQILIGVIGKSKAPRVTEICVGILGNMSCDANICTLMSKEQKLIDLVLLLLENRDPPTLVETTRLLYTSLSNPEARPPWISAIVSSSDVFDHLKFIFQSSTNCDLLKNAAEFVDVLLDLEESLCTKWSTTEFIQALLEAIKQIGCGHSDTLEVYFHLFQLLSTTEDGIEALVSCGEDLAKPLMKYLNVLCEDEIVGLEGRAQCLASALCVFNVLFSSDENIASMLLKDEKMMRIFLKILEPLVPWLNNLNESVDKEENKNDSNNKDQSNDAHCSKETKNKENIEAASSETDDPQISSSRSSEEVIARSGLEDSANLTDGAPKNGRTSKLERSIINTDEIDRKDLSLIYNFIKGFVYDYMFSLYMIESEETENRSICIHILNYLNDSCSRSRLNYFVLTLKETSTQDFNPADFLLEVAENYKEERLCRIIKDVNDGRLLSRSDSDLDNGKYNG